jgi:hypothetical protein
MIAGCGKKVPEPVPHPPNPHISWEIKVGDQDNPDKTSVCKSDPRSECVVPATTPEREVLATIHLYFHPATVETKYSGSAQVGFFGGSPAAHELKLDATVKPDESPATNTIYAIVTSQRGTHRVRIAAVASPVPAGRAANIREQINVTVR